MKYTVKTRRKPEHQVITTKNKEEKTHEEKWLNGPKGK